MLSDIASITIIIIILGPFPFVSFALSAQFKAMLLIPMPIRLWVRPFHSWQLMIEPPSFFACLGDVGVVFLLLDIVLRIFLGFIC